MKSHIWALGVPGDIVEMCPNRKLSGVAGICDKPTYFDERKEALKQRARFLVACEAGRNVIPITAEKVNQEANLLLETR